MKSLFLNQSFRKYFSNTSWMLSEKILRLTVGLFVGIWVARYLGPAQFGLFSYAQSIVALFIVGTTLGLDEILVREILKNPDKRDELLGTAFSLRICAAAIVLIVLAVVVIIMSHDRYTGTLIFIISGSIVFQAFNVIDLYFRSQIQGRFPAYANMVSLFFTSILRIILILNNASLEAFAVAVLIESVITAAGLCYFFIKDKLSFGKWKYKADMALYLLKNSWPLILSSFVITIYMKIDQIMLQNMLGSEAVGQYAAAVRISEAWYFIPVVICNSLLPALVGAKEAGEEKYSQRLQQLFMFMAAVSLVIAIPMTLISQPLVDFLYGVQYAEAAKVLTIHIWALLFVSMGVASGNWFILENMQMTAFWRTFCGVIISIVFNFSLIPLYGAVGAAVSTLLSQIIAAYVFDLLSSKTRKLFYMKTCNMLFIHFKR